MWVSKNELGFSESGGVVVMTWQGGLQEAGHMTRKQHFCMVSCVKNKAVTEFSDKFITQEAIFLIGSLNEHTAIGCHQYGASAACKMMHFWRENESTGTKGHRNSRVYICVGEQERHFAAIEVDRHDGGDVDAGLKRRFFELGVHHSVLSSIHFQVIFDPSEGAGVQRVNVRNAHFHWSCPVSDEGEFWCAAEVWADIKDMFKTFEESQLMMMAATKMLDFNIVPKGVVPFVFTKEVFPEDDV